MKEGVRHIRSLANRVLNKQGEVERLLGINMDMTEVKQLNEALFQEKERLHITLDSIGEAVLCTDIDMNVTFMNPVAEKMSGWLQTEAIGQPILKVLAHHVWGTRAADGEYSQRRYVPLRYRSGCGAELPYRRKRSIFITVLRRSARWMDRVSAP